MSEEYDGRRALGIQLARLFGADSKVATSNPQTPVQWKRTLNAVLDELAEYLAVNIDTDEVHQHMLAGALYGAKEALKQEEFWPGYVEGITRLAFLLIGDYPDHRRRKRGRKDQDHYKLDRLRKGEWRQTPHQRLLTLYAAGRYGFPELSADPMERLREFRNLYGFGPSQRAFLEWYRATYPNDYAAVFR